MAIKPGAETLTLLEQIIEDPVTGLTLQLRVIPGAISPFRLRIFGGALDGAREILFDRDGKKSGAESAAARLCRPTWIHEVNR